MDWPSIFYFSREYFWAFLLRRNFSIVSKEFVLLIPNFWAPSRLSNFVVGFCGPHPNSCFFMCFLLSINSLVNQQHWSFTVPELLKPSQPNCRCLELLIYWGPSPNNSALKGKNVLDKKYKQNKCSCIKGCGMHAYLLKSTFEQFAKTFSSEREKIFLAALNLVLP